MTPGLKALEVARVELAHRVREDPPGSNWSPKIRQYLASAGLNYPKPPGAPWCMAFVHYCFARGAGVQLGGWAGVGNFRGWAHEHGYLLVKPRERPFKGDVACYEWNGDNWPDHVGIIERVLALRWRGRQFVGWVQTIEGNTSSGRLGSQADGDGVYRRRRWMRPSYQFVRVT